MACGEGWVVDDLKVDQVGVTREECCSKTCSQVQCLVGWKVPESKLNSVAHEDGKSNNCCQPTCENHVCGHGYVKDSTKNGLFMPSNDRCCQKTCGAFMCPDGWVQDDAKSKLLATTAKECCKKTCKVHECSAGWLQNSENDDVVGSSNEICCDKTCAVHECKEGSLRPSAANNTGVSDQQCCEPKICALLRTLKESPTGHCNGIAEKECDGYYTILNQTTGKAHTEVFTKCSFDSQFGLCRMKDSLSATGCSPM